MFMSSADATGRSPLSPPPGPPVYTCSRDDATCAVCSLRIQRYAQIKPLLDHASNSNGLGKGVQWVHASCQQVGAEAAFTIPPCKHWMQRGTCAFQSSCAFLHEPSARNALAHVFNAPRRGQGNVKRLRIRNCDKAGVLRRFLSETFQLARKDATILDVAGGKGELAFQLRNLLNIENVAVVDPRPLALASFIKRYHHGHYHRNAAFSADLQKPKTTTQPPAHMPVLFHASLMQTVRNAERSVGLHAYEQAAQQGAKLAWSTKGLKSNPAAAADDDDESTTATTTNNNTLSFDEARHMLRSCTLITGIHVDQAAGDLVEFALQNAIPFAVVPCCTYQSEFPRRKLSDGTRVSTYEQLCNWLQERDENIQRAELPFDGKNTVLYWVPTST